MTSRRRDRHGRGLRGPLALTEPADAGSAHSRPDRPPTGRTSSPTPSRPRSTGSARQCPDALIGITVGIQDVPHFEPAWSGDQVPLAAALEATPDRPGQVVVYRRPLEHRAASRRGLRILVYRTIVEQLSALTGRSVDEIDPDGAGADED